MGEEGKSTPLVSPFQQRDDATRYLALGGYIFLAISALAFSMTSIILWLHLHRSRTFELPAEPQSSQIFAMLLAEFLPKLISLLSGLITALVGYALLRSAGTARREVIPRQDATLLYQLLLEKNAVALANYIKLASLSGFVGFCTELGIEGLPLTTIGLTIFFAVIGLAANSDSGFFDLAKLTLGAFIGSYVQRQRTEFGSQDTNPAPSGRADG